jgi:hypothetical protein
MHTIGAFAETPVAYQPKEKMPYWSTGPAYRQAFCMDVGERQAEPVTSPPAAPTLVIFIKDRNSGVLAKRNLGEGAPAGSHHQASICTP